MNLSPVALPVIIPILGGIAGILAPKAAKSQTWLAAAICAISLAASVYLVAAVDQLGYLSLAIGGWDSPFGISLVADRLGAAMVAISCLIGLAVSIYAVDDLDSESRSSWFHPLSLLLVGAVNGAFLTGDLFNLYVWFEILLIASFALMTIGGKNQQFEGGFKYVAINLVASAFFLAGLGLLYGKLGTLNMADIALKLSLSEDREMVTTSSLMLFVAFAVKAGLFPFFFWLPASYHTPPIAISALFAGLLTKVGVYALLRSYTTVFTDDSGLVLGALFTLSLATMITGVLGAASKYQVKRILSFHIVSQIGYMTLGLALFTQLAIAAAIFYTIHHIIVKTNLFLIAGIIEKKTGSDDLSKIGGLYKAAPWLTLLFFVPAFSLGGIPPLSGFWAKFALIEATLLETSYWAAAIALLVGVATLYSMTKIWSLAFWKSAPDSQRAELKTPVTWASFAPVGAFAALTLAIGFNASPLLDYSEKAATQLLDPNQYISAVLSADYIEALKQERLATQPNAGRGPNSDG